MTDSESPEELDLAKVAAVVEEAPATEATDETSSSSSEESKTSSTDETKPTATSTDKNDEGGGSGDATGTAIYAWASPTSGSMQVFDDKLNHVLLPGVSNGLTYACPKKGDSWKDTTLGSELVAKYAEGPGCYLEYTFKGDAVQIYGTTTTDSGIFGCFVTGGQRNATGWWDGGSQASIANAYQGSCIIQGLGFEEHTVRLINSPVDPKRVYFTGLRYVSNETAAPWSALEWSGCCNEYQWPDGEPPTVQIGGSTGNSTSGGTVVAGISNNAAATLVIVVIVIVCLASILLFAMCCKRRGSSGPSAQQRLQQALQDKRRRRKRSNEKDQSSRIHRRRSRREPSTDTEPEVDTTPSTTTGEPSTDGESDDTDEKHGRKSRRHR